MLSSDPTSKHTAAAAVSNIALLLPIFPEILIMPLAAAELQVARLLSVDPTVGEAAEIAVSSTLCPKIPDVPRDS